MQGLGFLFLIFSAMGSWKLMLLRLFLKSCWTFPFWTQSESCSFPFEVKMLCREKSYICNGRLYGLMQNFSFFNFHGSHSCLLRHCNLNSLLNQGSMDGRTWKSKHGQDFEKPCLLLTSKFETMKKLFPFIFGFQKIADLSRILVQKTVLKGLFGAYTDFL